MAALMFAASCTPVYADDASTLEYRVKAVCLYNFAKYVRWPDTAFATPQTPMKLCILGKNPFGELFNDVAGKTAQDRKLEVSIIESAKKASELSACQIVFWEADEDGKYGTIIDSLKSQPILTVSELPDRGIVNFFIQDGKVRFAIDVTKAKTAALTISSQLLKLAKVIGDDNSH